MGDYLGSSRLQVLFEAALEDYEKQTGIALDKHPLAEELQSCDSVESLTAVLREKTQAFSQFREKDKVLKPLKKAVSVLHKLSAAANIGQDIGLHFPPVKAIHTGLGVLFSVVKGSVDSEDALVNLFESIEQFLNRLDIYINLEIPPTVAMVEMVVNILVELLSTLALATKQLQQGRSKKLVKKLFGEKDVEVVLQRLDRLTQEEARLTAAQTFEVVCGLFQNMRVVMDDGRASVDHVMKALEIMQELASDLNKSKRDGVQQDILRWLLPPDPWKNHHIACNSRHRGSAAWFIQGNTFSDWKASESPSSSLWIHGKPGAGKSVFCSTIIEHLDAMRKTGLASLAFFYCDFREDQKRELRGLLSSLIVQLCHQSESYCDVIFKFYSEHAMGLRHPSDDALLGCLKELLKLPGLAPVYLVVDGLDECLNTSAIPSPRSKVLNLLKDLIESEFPNLHICVTSRPEADIKDVLGHLIFRRVSLHDQYEQRGDIKEYIESVINTHPTSRRWKAEHKQLVIDVLTKKADGMFRWVYCQVVYICACIPAGIKQALDDLPGTLDETYQRTLREISKANLEFAHRLFQFVAVATRPLRVEELADLLAFDFKAGPIPKFQEDWRLEDPVHAVLSTCSSLLTVVAGEHYGREEGRYRLRKVVQFSHYSVKEFLTSPRLAEANDTILRHHHVSMTPAHTLATQACLGILLHLDKNLVTSDNLEKWPLAEYAAMHWVDHVRIGEVSQKVKDGIKQLFDPSRPHLAVSVWIYNPDPQMRHYMAGRKRPFQIPPLYGTPLHYVALWDLHAIVEFLVIECSHDVHSQDFTDNATPLHLASKCGRMEAGRMLIKYGADVTAQDGAGRTPLHSATQMEQMEFGRMLIEHGADIMAQGEDGKTPLHLASQMGKMEVGRMLTKHGADVTAQDKDGRTPLHLASKEGEVEIGRMLIEHGADVTAQDKDGRTSLHLASQEGEVVGIGRLIEHGADVTAQDKDGRTPLHLASQEGKVGSGRILIKNGADVTAQDKNGRTSLHLASQEEVIRMLIDHDADLIAQDKDGHTPLNVALILGNMKAARTIIECGVDVTVQNKDGETPLHLASKLGEGWCLVNREPECLQAEVARMLIKRGADLASRNKNGETPLHLASRSEIACILILRGADLSAQNRNGETPLHLASSRFWDVAWTLIFYGADVSAQNKDGMTPLHLASKRGQVEVARLLIERGADVTAQDKDGQTPLHLALQEGQVEVARMLVEHGADVNT